MRTSIYSFLLGIGLILSSCSSFKVTNQQQDNTGFIPQKTLVVGVSDNPDTREYFEDKLSAALEKKGHSAQSSYQFFDEEFVTGERTEKKIKELKDWMHSKDYDAVIVSEITGSTSKLTWFQSMEVMSDNLAGIQNPEPGDQIFEGDTSPPNVLIYHIRTSLYQLTPARQESLIWQMDAEMKKPKKTAKGIDKYIKKLSQNFD